MPLGDDVERAYRRTYGNAGKRKQRHRIQGKLRTAENAQRICTMVEAGFGLPAIAVELGCTHPAIMLWIREDLADNNGQQIANAYTKSVEIRTELMAVEVLEIADDRSFMKEHPALAGAMVTQQRLAVDTRKWLMAKLMPRKDGDRVEISGNPDAPMLTRIELVAVHPAPRIEPPTIAADAVELTSTRATTGGDK